MPLMRMNRNWRVATVLGHTVVFAKGQPVTVPADQRVIEACLSAGAEYVDPTQAPALPDMVTDNTPAPMTQAQRKEKVFEIFRMMVADQEKYRDNFTAYGRPSAKFLSQTLKIDISAKETEEFWTEFQVK